MCVREKGRERESESACKRKKECVVREKLRQYVCECGRLCVTKSYRVVCVIESLCDRVCVSDRE